ncbi:hypothetical protein GUJ93_ZPchr0004g38171 [Zizania palustris]|uniref:Uncharacterized protein n=1 Tax=Zizania palustris TaxID=103762 RepID=A0A8J5VP95_ZIZPA|nr:hypothetical protein GUJ93_ZPchr0004g38171 [Zizania palustris]KAG8065806.1 hypothetical protein GUJ93_ZPchr0004g38171 [Zizania palustris]
MRTALSQWVLMDRVKIQLVTDIGQGTRPRFNFDISSTKFAFRRLVTKASVDENIYEIAREKACIRCYNSPIWSRVRR